MGIGMITKLTLRNFKSVSEQSYDFTQFDLLVGRNNSGKSTVLQRWQSGSFAWKSSTDPSVAAPVASRCAAKFHGVAGAGIQPPVEG